MQILYDTSQACSIVEKWLAVMVMFFWFLILDEIIGAKVKDVKLLRVDK